MITAEKQRLRERMKIISSKRSYQSNRHLMENLLRLISRKNPNSVLIYAPIEWEVDPRELMEAAPKRSYLFPKVAGDHLDIYMMNPSSRWMSGPYGISEPDPESWDLNNISEIDLAVVPGLAFDPKGGRLGRGKGFYDRLLSHPEFRGIKVGLAWDWQIVDEVPCESHDSLMDLVITPTKILEAGSTLDKLDERE
jgi:5-formyltetrahydrofolate cyclo-ligase